MTYKMQRGTDVKDTILIVDDENDLLHGLKRTVDMEMDCQVLIAENSIDAIELIKNEPFTPDGIYIFNRYLKLK